MTGDIRPTPGNNATLLAVGGVLANFIGTTGASMLLIRPLLRINQQRKRSFHSVIFFIFIVSNVGGCLPPLGDPPLFLGFLEGIPFFWTLQLWKEWVFMMALLLVAVTAYHAQLGLQVVCEDYISDKGARLVVLVALKFAPVIAALIGILAVLRIAFEAEA